MLFDPLSPHGCDCHSRRGFLTALGAFGAASLLPASFAGAQTPAPAPAGSPRRIDVHHHFFPPAAWSRCSIGASRRTIGRNVAGMASLGLAPETMAAIEHANADKLLRT
jgi:hypothetical protein